MHIDDSRLQAIVVDGQTLYVPSAEAWFDLLSGQQFAGRPLPVPDLLKRKVERLALHPELVAAIGFTWQRVHFYELLYVQGQYYRVFVEAVICDHCGHRAEISATPGVADIYWGSTDEAAARERSYGLPSLSCFSCGIRLSRRRTVWQVDAAAYPAVAADTERRG
jgi:hypothetical protein